MKSEPKQAEQVISLDIGSTFTKAGLFEVHSDDLKIQQSVRVPTTGDSLCRAVLEAVNKLGCLDSKTQRPTCPVFFSSSAKGGLHVIAVGIVPELTLHVAKQTALSAGAKVSRSFGYKLTGQDIRDIERLNPDIILLSGGTDGGNEDYLRHNAQMLSMLSIRPQVIFAGNRVLTDEIEVVLSDFPMHAVSNILPALDSSNVEDARQKICEVFLKSIISGKGLDEVVELLGRNPVPTPLAVMQLVEVINRYCDGWTDFCLIDMGGATTDVYSCTRDDHSQANVIYRGLPEPQVKRTVEGDLGIRTSAASTMIADCENLQESHSTEEVLAMMDYVDKITRQTSYLPNTAQERLFDRTLAEICMTQGLKRHVGTRKSVFTEQGEMFMQTGKNLSAVKKMILTGGYLSCLDEMDILSIPLDRIKKLNHSMDGMVYLVPREIDYYQDKNYLFPLLGNLVPSYPRRSALSAVKCLVSFQSKSHLVRETTC